jgi:hypothetical protein
MLAKLLAWLPLNLASIIGIVQGVIKVLKEVLTAITNILFPLIPGDGNFEAVVIKIRSIVNTIDGALEKIKAFLLKAIG